MGDEALGWVMRAPPPIEQRRFESHPNSSGPMYVQYNNGALRSGATKGRYVTTIHAINSGILKLSRNQRACTVWRGVHNGLLPDEFWRENEHGVMGGVERAFMSTTTSREVAESFARGDQRGAAMLFKVRVQGSIQRRRGPCVP